MSQIPTPGPRSPVPVDLSVDVAGIRMRNPVMTASGTFGYAREFEQYMDLNRLGALVVKTITRLPRAGNPPPRIVETPAGMLNAIGLQNVGIEAFIREKLPYLRRLEPPLIVNVAGESVEDFRDLTKRIGDQEGVAGIELNVSCPNVAGGLDFSTDPSLAYRVVKAARDATRLPIIPKLSPNVTDIVAVASGGGRRRRRRDLADQHAGRHGRGCADAPAEDRERDWRPLGTGHPSGGGPHGLAGGPGGPASHHRHGRHRDGGGCSGIHHCGSHGRGDRHGQLH